jgi:hypothetical protein
MCLMNDAFQPFLDSFVIMYFDDILIFSSTFKVHISHMIYVLETLRKHPLLEILKKCEFSQQFLVFVTT